MDRATVTRSTGTLVVSTATFPLLFLNFTSSIRILTFWRAFLPVSVVSGALHFAKTPRCLIVFFVSSSCMIAILPSSRESKSSLLHVVLKCTRFSTSSVNAPLLSMLQAVHFTDCIVNQLSIFWFRIVNRDPAV